LLSWISDIFSEQWDVTTSDGFRVRIICTLVQGEIPRSIADEGCQNHPREEDDVVEPMGGLAPTEF